MKVIPIITKGKAIEEVYNPSQLHTKDFKSFVETCYTDDSNKFNCG